MAFVARSLWLLLSFDGAFVATPERDREETKSRVHNILKPAENRDGAQHQAARAQEQDAEGLRNLADSGDPVASALLGATIRRGLIGHEVDGDYQDKKSATGSIARKDNDFIFAV
ncbi:hypothetical protein J3458_009173 [Metarhizium acridum]|uniref:uncharacterized protein n=1 Tax=Metarhizium acridum TaxID=92637 RepID=UPI001C6B860B|nr:hypothetical protein J3458_009173 [Metarhizium acridum]